MRAYMCTNGSGGGARTEPMPGSPVWVVNFSGELMKLRAGKKQQKNDEQNDKNDFGLCACADASVVELFADPCIEACCFAVGCVSALGTHKPYITVHFFFCAGSFSLSPSPHSLPYKIQGIHAYVRAPQSKILTSGSLKYEVWMYGHFSPGSVCCFHILLLFSFVRFNHCRVLFCAVGGVRTWTHKQ